MGMRIERINKIPDLDDLTGDIHFLNSEAKGEGIYLPYAAFTTAAARAMIIRDAQRCYDQKLPDGRGRFVYADTDSIHIIGDPPEDLWIDPKELGALKNEGRFPVAKYLRPKTYIHCNSDYSVYTEKLKHKDGTETTVPEGLKCAGMPDAIKMSLIEKGGTYAWDNFWIGNTFPGKKVQVRVRGGLLIRETTYQLKEETFRNGLL